jgi:6-oxo-cyclohex-1-ene-carbonyl-CoA hydrolase
MRLNRALGHDQRRGAGAEGGRQVHRQSPVETSRITEEYGRFVFGKPKTGDALKAGQDLMKRGTIELTLLDDKVEALCTKLLYTFPDCTAKTVEEMRKPKLDAWNSNKENSRAFRHSFSLR